MWGGFVLMITTGFAMFWPLKEYLLYHTPFQIKMIFVLALFINGFFIGKFTKVATELKFSEITKTERNKLFLSGAVSSISWAGAIISAFLMNI